MIGRGAAVAETRAQAPPAAGATGFRLLAPGAPCPSVRDQQKVRALFSWLNGYVTPQPRTGRCRRHGAASSSPGTRALLPRPRTSPRTMLTLRPGRGRAVIRKFETPYSNNSESVFRPAPKIIRPEYGAHPAVRAGRIPFSAPMHIRLNPGPAPLGLKLDASNSGVTVAGFLEMSSPACDAPLLCSQKLLAGPGCRD